MQRPQKTAQVGCPCEGMLETKSNRGACSIALTETERKDSAENNEYLVSVGYDDILERYKALHGGY